MTGRIQTLCVALIAWALIWLGQSRLRADENGAVAPGTNQPAPAKIHEKLKELPPGNHKLLETMTKNLGLSLDQQLEIEPLLHDEESVSKPILGFPAFSPAQKQAMLLIIKHAARRQIRPLLTPEQQIKADAEDAGLNAKAGGKGGGKKPAAPAAEEDVIKAIVQYDALSQSEKDTMIAKVKDAAQHSSQLSPAPSTAQP